MRLHPACCLAFVLSRPATSVSLYENCMGNVAEIGDGYCNGDNHNADCGYDEGDCCECANASESSTGIIDDPAYDCRHDPPCACNISIPCPAEGRVDLEVYDQASATDLAEAVRCSGGAFNIRWKGDIVLNKTICVASGTSINVTGIDVEAGVRAAGGNRLFTVVDGTLSVRNMTISDGSGPNGGAIYATRSNLFLGPISFVDNTAGISGGALYVIGGSTVYLDGGTVFRNSSARGLDGGGAVFVNDSSRVWCSGNTDFLYNTCHDTRDLRKGGGAAFVGQGSSLTCSWAPRFVNNFGAKRGGALYVDDGASASFSGRTIFEHNNAGHSGGAVYVEGPSTLLSFSGETSFIGNHGDVNGGAVCAIQGSMLQFAGETIFGLNDAEYSGGAVYASSGVSLSFSGRSIFDRNRATSYHGGALRLFGCNATWGGVTSFVNNTAGDNGGGAIIAEGSTTCWEAETDFSNNFALSREGALYIHDSEACWKSGATFSDNVVGHDGGALAIIDGSRVSWVVGSTMSDSARDGGGDGSSAGELGTSHNSSAVFSRNVAGFNGGAIFLDKSKATWMTSATFDENIADSNGDAVHLSSGAAANLGAEASFLYNSASGNGGALNVLRANTSMTGDTRFLSNKCKGSGGGMMISGDSNAVFEMGNVVFYGNSGLVAGGGIFMSGVDGGLRLVGLTFTLNSAQIGGAAYVTGSGSFLVRANEDYEVVENPILFDQCSFVGNTATATGGAMLSSAGQTVVTSTLFEANFAAVGGALRLAGTTSLHNSTFVENISGENEGPAVSNVGYILSMSHVAFSGNVFWCTPGTFLSYEAPETEDDLMDILCQGCNTECQTCKAPGEIPVCRDQMEHTVSAGGNTTLESLWIEPGFWRASNTSEEILACYNEAACLGGMTKEDGYCQDGYEGPYCAVCSEGYTASLGFGCNKCSRNFAGIMIAFLVALCAVLALVGVVSYVLSGKGPSRWRSAGSGSHLSSWMRRLYALKIVIVVWQILTQFATVANVVYPDVYQRFLDGVNLLNFDLNWIPSTWCIVDLGFHDRLIMATTVPLTILAVLGALSTLAHRMNGRSSGTLHTLRQNHLSMVLLLTFLVYSPVSSILFQMFACDHLDNGKVYLRADYRVECDSAKHRALQAYAALMMLLYTVGIPIFFGIILYSNRRVLQDEEARENDPVAISMSNLWELYKPNCIYFELVECARRVSLAGIVVFIYPNTAAQVAVAVMMGGFFMLVAEVAAPYASPMDSWISRAGHAIVCTSMFMALLLKVDVTNERAHSQHVFESILVAAHVCMVLAVIGEAVMVTCQSVSDNQTEEFAPKWRSAVSVAMALFKGPKRTSKKPKIASEEDVSNDRPIELGEVVDETRGWDILGRKSLRIDGTAIGPSET